MHDVQNKHIRSPITLQNKHRAGPENRSPPDRLVVELSPVTACTVVPRRTLRVRTRPAQAQDLRFDLLAVARSNN